MNSLINRTDGTIPFIKTNLPSLDAVTAFNWPNESVIQFIPRTYCIIACKSLRPTKMSRECAFERINRNERLLQNRKAISAQIIEVRLAVNSWGSLAKCYYAFMLFMFLFLIPLFYFSTVFGFAISVKLLIFQIFCLLFLSFLFNMDLLVRLDWLLRLDWLTLIGVNCVKINDSIPLLLYRNDTFCFYFVEREMNRFITVLMYSLW